MKNFDEGFDNILIFDYDSTYKSGNMFLAEELIGVDGREYTSMNGMWNFSPDTFESTVRSRWFDEVKLNRDGLPLPYDYDFDLWDEVQVPGTWNQSRAEYKIYEGMGVYSKRFSYHFNKDNRVYLRIGAANYETRVWINKTYLGRHLGGFTPFMVDITDHLREDNRILISVNNTRKGEQVPSLHYDWFNYGGIHRDVSLYEIPNTYIKNHHFFLINDGTYSKIGYKIEVNGKSCDCVNITIQDLNIHHSEKLVWNNEQGIVHGIIEVNPKLLKLWTPNVPTLYTIALDIGGDKIVDCIGFRTIETNGTDILLNGESIFLKGMCVHEESFENGRAVTKEDIINTLVEVKEHGM